MMAAIEWIVILPDIPGSLETRLKLREQHLENLTKHVKSGLFQMGGAYLSEVFKGSGSPSFLGSIVLARASTKEEVLDTLKTDVYSTGHVWDMDKIEIYPFLFIPTLIFITTNLTDSTIRSKHCSDANGWKMFEINQMISFKMHCTAITTQSGRFVQSRIEVPSLGPNQILIRIHFAALNPTDVLAYDLDAFGDGAVLGCDFSGTVHDVGSHAKRFRIGDNVAAFVWGGELPNIGAFSEYCIADERIAFKVPPNISMDQAATLPLAAATAFLALFSEDCLNLSRHDPLKDPLLVLGGSSSVGSFALQIARHHGIRTICTGSQKNSETIQANGAGQMFDYHHPDMVQHIQEAFPDLHLIFDTVGNPTSSSTAMQVLGSKQSHLCTVRPGKAHTEGLPSHVQISDVFVFTAFLKEHSYRSKAYWPIHYKNHELAKQFFEQLPSLISAGQIKPRPVRLFESLSVQTIAEATELMRSGEVSNEKVCFAVMDGYQPQNI